MAKARVDVSLYLRLVEGKDMGHGGTACVCANARVCVWRRRPCADARAGGGAGANGRGVAEIDTYATVKLDHRTKLKTKTIYASDNPLWDEDILLYVVGPHERKGW